MELLARSSEQVLSELDDYIREHRYARHPFVRNVEAGKYDALDVRRWAVQKYFQTRDQNCVYSAIHARSRHFLDIRRFEVQQLIDEETEFGEGSEPHYELMRRFALALGASDEAFDERNIGPGVHRFVDYLQKRCSTGHPVYGILAIYVNESQTSESARKLGGAFAEQFGLSAESLEWFTVHGEADLEHAARGRELICRYGGDLADFAEKAREVVVRGVEEWTGLQDFYAEVLAGRCASG